MDFKVEVKNESKWEDTLTRNDTIPTSVCAFVIKSYHGEATFLTLNAINLLHHWSIDPSSTIHWFNLFL